MSKTPQPGVRQATGVDKIATIVAAQSSATQLRKDYLHAARLCSKERMLAENSAEQPKEKRSERLTLNLGPSERKQLEHLARSQRIEAAVTARNIILDFLEGKLVPALEQPLPVKEVAA